MAPALIILAGPTASGKSRLALALAEALRGTIINADSMQLYRELRILTARPTPAEEARIPHRLYGVLDAAAPGSAGHWLELAGAEIAGARAAGRVPILVGGSGLYLRALLEGIAPVPDIPEAGRSAARATFARLGARRFRAALGELDPEMATRLGSGDPQRMMRAYEVVRATGSSLADWQRLPRHRLALPEPRLCLALLPPREPLNARIERRLRVMVEHGGLEEVRDLARRGVPRDLPLMKAVAVPELLAHVEGRVDLASALARASAKTRRYAKRQRTWLRHQMPQFEPVAAFGDDPASERTVLRLTAPSPWS